ncbi:MAG: AmmeMemoRadiSam system radical SAM enzyme [candidate division KSB1 bacterium]|nr:AmmeMemoRadiSam system radical SAM enzyme [candidate division KSB1 bacterium]MDZ7335577.1 AmmeMemoRadiSam system radical SAM enzyme [candidate division KSB1 bacterium]MDZ7356449.1 AmmeMemoRadiSam system radical SAM enzyme [candidate division KSB1 bacterium]MDZ7377275.1 AmmeMemoRadiSam system radical SAM enzyme [candidate division KSB1 bacterium]MDZ7401220.1 AmmeMemoRadiSam system radical SAM enzyme [candidate division KSB1 bacterium]
MKEAMFYQIEADQRVVCQLCPHDCRLKPGQVGICGVRQNIDGKLFSLVYGKAIALHIDPIEKKPLFHVLPGSQSFSIATVGCNFHCKFCQNYDISQVRDVGDIDRFSREISPEELVKLAKHNRCQSIAYTYTEPTIYFEYAYDTAQLAHQQGLLNVFVTNGYINPEPLQKIHDVLDAANVDLKSFNDQFYRKMTGGKLQPVLETLKLMKKLDIYVEITTLLIPGENDSDEELTAIAEFIKNDLGVDTPWHISRFYPHYRLTDHSPTPVASLNRARDIGLAQGLRYVYLGNVPGSDAENTYCYNCGKLLIERYGFQIIQNHIKAGNCRFCGTKIDGLFGS